MATKVKIREFRNEDTSTVLRVINDSAKAYKSVLPPNVYKEPQMSLEEFLEEAKRIKFYVAEFEGKIVGVMGYEYVKDVCLIRHAYIKLGYQRIGIGTLLLKHLENLIKIEGKTRKLIVGTYAKAYWAIAFYRKHGFNPVSDSDSILRSYYKIPDIQRKNSVALKKSLTS